MSSKLIVEFIGTFFLVLVVAFSGNPIAVGAILMAMVYMGGHISGAHYNPAVSTALYLQKKIDGSALFNYIVIQMAAAVCAAAVYLWVSGSFFIPAAGPQVNFWQAFLLEVLFTFALVSVVLNTAVSDKTKGNNYFGLAIGFTVAAGAFAAGPISGGAFNPAVGIGPLLLNFQNLGNNISSLLLYSAGPVLGGLIASLVFTRVNSKK